MNKADQEADVKAGDDLATAHARIIALSAELDGLKQAHAAALDTLAMVNSEAQVRTRNQLAVIRSVFRRTIDTGISLVDVAEHFTGRLDALARRQAPGPGVLTHGVEVEDIVHDELLSATMPDSPLVTIHGPPAALDYRQAELVGLAVHELATNSIKFGVLGSGRGSLAITWTVLKGDAPRLSFMWEESGNPVLAPAPLRSGFGRQFIEQALPYQLKAEARLELRAGGVTCEIVLPIAPDLQAADPDN